MLVAMSISGRRGICSVAMRSKSRRKLFCCTSPVRPGPVGRHGTTVTGQQHSGLRYGAAQAGGRSKERNGL